MMEPPGDCVGLAEVDSGGACRLLPGLGFRLSLSWLGRALAGRAGLGLALPIRLCCLMAAGRRRRSSDSARLLAAAAAVVIRNVRV